MRGTRDPKFKWGTSFYRSIFPLKIIRHKAELGFVFSNMSSLIKDTVVYVTGSKSIKLKEKLFYCGTNFLNTLYKYIFHSIFLTAAVAEWLGAVVT